MTTWILPALLLLSFASAQEQAATQGPAPKLHYQAIYSDMDGTLLDGSNGVRKATLEALESFRKCGGKLGLASGRTLEQVRPYLHQLNPNLPLILSNGAVAYSPDGTKLLWSAHLPAEQARSTTALATGRKGVEGIVIQELDATFVDREEGSLRSFLEKSHIRGYKVSTSLAQTYQGQALKVMVIVANRKSGDSLRKHLQQKLGDQVNVMVTSSRTVEIVPNHVDKSWGIRKALAAAGIPVDQTVVFGDGDNDATMVGTIGLGVAMGNCREATCAACDVLIGPASTDSIAKFIRSLILTPACSQ